METGQQPKFKVGDRVRFTSRAPKYIMNQTRKRTRTIGRTYRSAKRKCCYYQLCSKGKTVDVYPFRSYMLMEANTGKKHSYNGRKSRYRFLLATQEGRE